MKKNNTIFIGLVITYSVIFNPVLNASEIVRTTKHGKYRTKETVKKLRDVLSKKGLESEKIDSVMTYFNQSSESAIKMMVEKLSMDEDKIIETISKELLHNKVIAFNSADSIIGFVQKVDFTKINEKNLKSIYSFIS